MYFKRLCDGLNDRGRLLPENEINENIIKDTDYYVSLFDYNEPQYKHFLEHNTIAGITDVTTNKLAFDFDSLDNLELARTEALELITRLESTLKVPQKAVQMYFSGKKGFTIIVNTNLRFTPNQLKEVCYKQLGK